MIAWLRRLLTRTSGTAASTTAGTGTDTEFCAEVVRVNSVRSHPNADRLEIATFDLKASGPSAYEVVIQKGTYTVDSLAAYLSVDCIVPTDHSEFRFLTERLDGAGKTHYRLRAARLRGTFSQGLLVKPPDGAQFGDSVAEAYGVTYHRAPEPEEARGPTPPGKKKPQPMPIYGVESLKKVPRLFEEGEGVLVTEKIHGTNFRFGWVPRKFLGIRIGWKFVVGSHRVMKDEGGPGWYGEDVWTRAAKDMHLAERTRDYKGFAFYGELYGHTYSGQKIQDLTYGVPPDGPDLAVFDVMGPDGEWLKPSARMVVLADVDLTEVPTLYVGPYTPALLTYADGKSTLDDKTIREGVVIESCETRKKAKFVSQGYLLRKDA